MQQFLSGLIPPPVQAAFSFLFSLVGTACGYLFGWNDALEALLILMALDYVSGVLAAYIHPEMKLDSAAGFKGIAKKVMVLVLVALSHLVDKSVGTDLVQSMVTLFFVGNEGLSVIENASNAGIPIPKKLKDTLAQFRERKPRGK